MASNLPDAVVRPAGEGDVAAVAALRALWKAGTAEDPGFERRMAYVGDMFVREDVRGRGVGSALLAAVVAAADARGYARLVLSPTARSVPFYRRVGFVVPDDTAGDNRLLVRPGRPRPGSSPRRRASPAWPRSARSAAREPQPLRYIRAV